MTTDGKLPFVLGRGAKVAYPMYVCVNERKIDKSTSLICDTIIKKKSLSNEYYYPPSRQTPWFTGVIMNQVKRGNDGETQSTLDELTERQKEDNQNKIEKEVIKQLDNSNLKYKLQLRYLFQTATDGGYQKTNNQQMKTIKKLGATWQRPLYHHKSEPLSYSMYYTVPLQGVTWFATSRAHTSTKILYIS